MLNFFDLFQQIDVIIPQQWRNTTIPQTSKIKRFSFCRKAMTWPGVTGMTWIIMDSWLSQTGRWTSPSPHMIPDSESLPLVLVLHSFTTSYACLRDEFFQVLLHQGVIFPHHYAWMSPSKSANLETADLQNVCCKSSPPRLLPFCHLQRPLFEEGMMGCVINQVDRFTSI